MIREYSLDYLSELILQHYGLKGKLQQLSGYTDQNYALQTEQEGKIVKYAVKISSKFEKESLILLQNHVFKQLVKQKAEIGCEIPLLLQTLDGQDMLIERSEDGCNFIRVVTFIKGKEMWEIQNAPVNLVEQAGQIAGKLALFLSKESIEKIGKGTQQESGEHFGNVCSFISHFERYYAFLDEPLRPIVSEIKNEFHKAIPILSTIPKQVLHNDICLTNLLVSQNQSAQWFISGLIDFGNMIYSYRIIELIILCARSNLYKPDPLRNVFQIIIAFNQVRKLTQAQKQVLFPMIKVRLACLALLSSFFAAQKHQDPYFQKCKNGHIYYLTIFANACSNQQFLVNLQSLLQGK